MQNISQNSLAEDAGISFQQIQKYEKGVNRMSASRLFQLANILGVSTATFFENLPGTATQTDTVQDSKFQKMIDLVAKDSKATSLLESYSRIDSSELRHAVLHLVLAVASSRRPEKQS